MIKKTLGGDRLGSGKKMSVEMKSYERSTHDLSYVWRSSMASGTLVPFMSQIALPGDTWDIDLEVDIKTHPTLGPLFGSYKVQLDVFSTPIRLYNSWLHNNKIGIGMNMSQILLPQIQLQTLSKATLQENQQINPSALYKYLGISGLGAPGTGIIDPDTEMDRLFNAIPVLTYYEIFKNYYANKQETNAYVIHTENFYPTGLTNVRASIPTNIPRGSGSAAITLALGDIINIQYDQLITIPGIEYTLLDQLLINFSTGDPIPIKQVYQASPTALGSVITIEMDNPAMVGKVIEFYTTPDEPTGISLIPFPLENIDTMREAILATDGNTLFQIDKTTFAPYGLPLQNFNDQSGTGRYPMEFSQEGLLVKTYNSDLLNNWIETETQAFISTISAIDTSTGSFTIDSLNLAQKVYNMLNRIAVSGGTYDDWIETVWTNETMRKAETPMYMGGLIKELAFQELVSTAASTVAGNVQPQGQLAGKGILTGKHKGGKIQIKCSEPSYITGIISLTPRIDYSQGNTWDMNLKTMDDFHKPELDEIGFQDLITEQMAWYGTKINLDGTITTHSAGKQPAWINYMTNINKTYGNFAEPLNEMFMTLNRQYEINTTNNDIKDITTYIDPTKYNFIFAETDLASQNFWAQIGINSTVRRKMSAKLIPNL
jgi:hypothetical protein